MNITNFASHDSHNEPCKLEFIRGLMSPHVYQQNPVEGLLDMPMVAPYNDEIPTAFVQFSDTSRIKDYTAGVHCYQADERINPLWTNPTNYVARLKQYTCVIAPDFSLFLDVDKMANMWNVYRNRKLSNFWASQGIKVIPSASWGNANSLAYCFDGLPEKSIISIGHIAIGKDRQEKRLYRFALETLVEKKSPTGLLVYGSPLDFDPGVKVYYRKDRIMQLRELRK